MEGALYVFYFFLAIFLITLVIALITRKKQPKEWKEAYAKLNDMFATNKGYTKNEIFENLNIPFEYDLDQAKDFLKIKNSERESELFTSYFLALTDRLMLRSRAISPMQDVNIQLRENETVYFSQFADLHKMKTISSNVTYSGLRLTSGLARAGSLSYISNDIRNFSISDIGMLYLTNKRIIFIGKREFKVVTIDLGNILTYYFYMNGIIILPSSGSPVLFKINEITYNLIEHEVMDPFSSDEVNKFMVILGRIMEGTQDIDLK